jgi:hypothetical protein
LWCGWGVSGGRGPRARDVLRMLQPLRRQRQMICPNSDGPAQLGVDAIGGTAASALCPPAIDAEPLSLGRDQSNPPS